MQPATALNGAPRMIDTPGRDSAMTQHPNTSPGYKNPPEKTRFQRGVSGNARGRPKQVASLKSEMLHELGRPAGTSESGVSNAAAIAKSLVAAAVRGNLRATHVLLNFCGKQLSEGANPQETSATADSEILADFLDREIRRRQQQGEAIETPAAPETATKQDTAP